MIKFTADFGPVIEGLAVGDAYLALDANYAYWDAVIDYAFHKADIEFNQVAAATAATGHIKHMFEWGTLGVNRQATNMRPRPTDERARLWKNILIDGGPKEGAKLYYEFKPSVANVPISTAVPQEIRSLMRKHQFTWKAKVMEEGTPVHIARNEAQFLLIPYNPSMTGFRPHDKKRGYTLTTGTIYAIPGRNSQGTFTAFWNQFWSKSGPEIMQMSVEKQLQEDFIPMLAAAGTKKMVMPPSVTEAVAERSKILQKEAAGKAKARRTRNEF